MPTEPASCGAPPLFPFPESKPGLLQYSPQPVVAPPLVVACAVESVVAWVVVDVLLSASVAGLPWPWPWLSL
ncbi:MAG TPA: hypothetical protein VG602_09915 [Actinomycetota bacterium]|nr:hypothetical protein [Actinomycetota bacterium]